MRAAQAKLACACSHSRSAVCDVLLFKRCDILQRDNWS